MTEAELLPCPFCGGRADWNEQDGITGVHYYCECAPEETFRGCIRQSIAYSRKSEAIRAWNTRNISKGGQS